ncbi:MAG: GtrA family protein [Clostridiales bacterium]|nr:GtrA family protein [Clostridiales bacterium]
MVEKIKNLLEKYGEIIRYIIIGGATTAVNWVTYSVLVKFLHLNINVSNTIAWIAAVAFAYVTNKLFVFKDHSKTVPEEIKKIGLFVGSRVLTGILEIAGLPLLMKAGLRQTILGVEGLFAKIIVSVIVIILNYIFSKIFVFKKNKE